MTATFNLLLLEFGSHGNTGLSRNIMSRRAETKLPTKCERALQAVVADSQNKKGTGNWLRVVEE